MRWLNKNMDTTKETTQKEEKQMKTIIDGDLYQSAFVRKPRLLRSPPQKMNTPLTKVSLPTRAISKTGNELEETTPQKQDKIVTSKKVMNIATETSEAIQTPITAKDVNTARKKAASPRQEFILRMRAEEEEAVEKCLRVLRKMKAVLLKSRNTSTDIKTGVSELDELFDVMKSCRRGWIQAEKTGKVRLLTDPSTNEIGGDTPATARKIGVVQENTPLNAKRNAESPAAPDSSKKPRVREPEKWQVVSRQKSRPKAVPKGVQGDGVKKAKENKKKNERVPKPKSEAILVKPVEGHSYAEILKNIRGKTMPDETTTVKGIRRTKTGALLLELGRGKTVSPDFLKQLEETVKAVGSITTLRPTSTVEIRDLDAVTEKKEVDEAVRKLLADTNENIEVRITKPNQREQVRAYVTLAIESAEKLLQQKTLKIGWVSARMRASTSLKRCYRCFGVGHLQSNCKGPDRSGKGLCIRCGEAGHKMKECIKELKCCLCTDANRSETKHMPGSGKCPMTKEHAKT